MNTFHLTALIYFFSVTVIAFFSSFFITKFLISYLNNRKILDIPNHRSNHTIPVPRGGGIAIIISVLGYYGLTKFLNYPTIFNNYLITSILILSVISFIDDIKPLNIFHRFAAQFVAVAIALYSLPNDKLLFSAHIPLIFDRLISLFALIWFINLYNFMDGIDGITGAESLHILVSVLIIFSLFWDARNSRFIGDYLVMIFAISGFLYWNWHPAKIFLGDIGSINLGFILGWILYNIALDKHIITAIIIPAYYIADSGITILKRLLQGKKIWQAHSEHFYQLAVKNGKTHKNVVKRIVVANIFLLIASILSIKSNTIPIILALVTISTLLISLKKSNLEVKKIEQKNLG
ncbi:MAG: MraY family glycosyltransferase [Alphaproteobacteria bacterium]